MRSAGDCESLASQLSPLATTLTTTTPTTAANVHFCPIIPGVNDHLAREELDGAQYHDEPREEARGEVLENGHLGKLEVHG